MEKHIENIVLLIIMYIFIIYTIKECENNTIYQFILGSSIKVSKLLTDDVRNYIITGDMKYKDDYFKVENVRDGDGNWGIIFMYPWFMNHNDTISNLITYLGLNENESSDMQTVIDISIKMIWDDIVAMNWYDGRTDVDNVAKNEFDNIHGSKRFIQFKNVEKDKIKHDQLKQNAADLLFSDAYLTNINTINKISENVTRSYTKRMQSKLTFYKIIIFILMVIILTKFFYTY